jgi:endonuclease/exonuclease/phosphatase family metal-dependent hydrolase
MRRVSIISPKVFIKGSVILLSTLFLLLPDFATAQDFTVMTRNLYIGAEIQSLAAAGTEEEFIAGVQAALMQMAANNFPERALALAAEIVEKKPHLVGLQEVYNLTINGGNSLPPFRDYLEDLLNALEGQGADYYVAATVVNLNLSLTIAPVDVGVIDRDVILARGDVETEVVDLTSLCPPWRQSMDGCNYQFVASANTPVGAIAFQRGYVGVDTLYGRFFNTHLEVRDPDPDNLLSPLVQRLQAMELIFVLDALNVVDPPSGPIIVVGDINSSPEDPDTIPEFKPPYMQLEDAGNVDAWTLQPGKPKGFTCCYDEDLSIAADLYERVDVIFSSEEPDRVKANVVGNDEADQTPSGLWPSDHAGVVARMKFAP